MLEPQPIATAPRDGKVIFVANRRGTIAKVLSAENLPEHCAEPAPMEEVAA